MRANSYPLALSAAVGSVFLDSAPLAQESADGLVIDEIVVTAQRRTENLSEVPISISVFDAETIDQTGVQELRELSEYIPNVVFAKRTEFSSQIIIRGVGANSRNLGFDTRVGVYLDGVYLGQSPALNQDLLDLERVEVLRGPQGTLFGKNTVAGAISLISRKPDENLSADVTANVFNYNGLELRGIVNIPASDSVSTRISVSHRERDGYITNVWDTSHVPTTANFAIGGTPTFDVPLCDSLGGSTPPGCMGAMVGPDTSPNTSRKLNDVDTQSYRAQLRIQPNDKLDINFAIDRLKSDNHAPVGTALTDTFGSTVDRFAPGFLDVSISEDVWQKRDLYGANLNIDYALHNGFSLKSITAFRDTEINAQSDFDHSAIDYGFANYTDAYEQMTQEFQLVSPNNADLKYVAGLYYYNQDGNSIRHWHIGDAGWLFGLIPGTAISNWGDVKTDSWAVFFNGTYDFADQWRLGFGFRYSDETKDVIYSLDGTQSGIFGIGTTPPGGYADSQTYTNLSPTLSLSYAINGGTNVYGRYSTGFKSGGYNLDFITQDYLDAGISFQDETVESFELGLKGRVLDNRLSFNIAAFLTRYEDYQVNQFLDLGFDPVTETQMTSIRITNAAGVESSGLELEASFHASDNLTFSGSLGMLDAKFDDFPGGMSIAIADPTIPGGIRRDPVNAAGNRLPFAPEISATFGIQHYLTIDVLDSDFLVRLDVLHTGDYFTTIENESTRDLTGTHGATFTFDIDSFGTPNTIEWGHVDAITTINGRIGLIDADGAWDVYLWGRNITDESEYVDYRRDGLGTLFGVPMTPRTLGIEASYHFN